MRGEAGIFFFYRDTETILLMYCATFLTSESSMCGAIVLLSLSVSLSCYHRFLVSRRVAVLRLVNFAVSNVKSRAVRQIAERGTYRVTKRDFLAAR